MITSKLLVPDALCHFDPEERSPICGEKHQDTICAMNNLANTLVELGQVQKAISSLEVTKERMRLQIIRYKDIKPQPTYLSMIWLRLYVRGPMPKALPQQPICSVGSPDIEGQPTYDHRLST